MNIRLDISRTVWAQNIPENSRRTFCPREFRRQKLHLPQTFPRQFPNISSRKIPGQSPSQFASLPAELQCPWAVFLYLKFFPFLVLSYWNIIMWTIFGIFHCNVGLDVARYATKHTAYSDRARVEWRDWSDGFAGWPKAWHHRLTHIKSRYRTSHRRRVKWCSHW